MAWQLMMRVTMAWEVAMTRLVTATIVANTIPRMRVALVEEADNVRDVCSVCTECPHSYNKYNKYYRDKSFTKGCNLNVIFRM